MAETLATQATGSRVDLAKYALFASFGLMTLFVLWNNERFLVDPQDPAWAHYSPVRWHLIPHGVGGTLALALGAASNLRGSRPTARPALGQSGEQPVLPVGRAGGISSAPVETIAFDPAARRSVRHRQPSGWQLGDRTSMERVQTRAEAAMGGSSSRWSCKPPATVRAVHRRA